MTETIAELNKLPIKFGAVVTKKLASIAQMCEWVTSLIVYLHQFVLFDLPRQPTQ